MINYIIFTINTIKTHFNNENNYQKNDLFKFNLGFFKNTIIMKFYKITDAY